ncbi:adenosine deaminase [Aquipuribacter nitratireducens]|uniref:Adenosine deaminase n=1 Tax=Aquipuribacter nitratireducens TaxID=650104 RepID=A0ABW0GH87_9MICO
MPPPPGRRDLATLPKAHLHLHFTGSMRPGTLSDLAERHDLRLPAVLREHHLLRLPPDERGWFRFQRLYEAARACVRTADDMRRLVLEAAADDAAEGSRHLELQIDPTSYAPLVGGLTSALEVVLDAARDASRTTGCHVAVVVAASRLRHPLDARALARLAARYAGTGPGEVVGFGLSNDERRGDTAEFARAFDIARRAGLAAVPHGGELLGADHVAEVVDVLRPDRLGHGVRSSEDPGLLRRLVDAGVGFEVCPASNVGLGVYADAGAVPGPALLRAGASVALGADDPLLFGSRLVAQYATARDVWGLDDAALADLARASLRLARVEEPDRRRWLGEVDAWLATPAPAEPAVVRG